MNILYKLVVVIRTVYNAFVFNFDNKTVNFCSVEYKYFVMTYDALMNNVTCNSW